MVLFINPLTKAKTALLLWQKSLLQQMDGGAPVAATGATTTSIHQEIAILAQQIEDFSQIQPFNCFTLSFSSQVSGLSVMFTYAIVLFQFKSSEILG